MDAQRLVSSAVRLFENMLREHFWCPKSSPRAAKRAEERPKSSPKAAKSGLRVAKSSPRGAKSGQESPKSSPREAKSGPRATQEQPKNDTRQGPEQSVTITPKVLSKIF